MNKKCFLKQNIFVLQNRFLVAPKWLIAIFKNIEQKNFFL